MALSSSSSSSMLRSALMVSLLGLVLVDAFTTTTTTSTSCASRKLSYNHKNGPCFITNTIISSSALYSSFYGKFEEFDDDDEDDDDEDDEDDDDDEEYEEMDERSLAAFRSKMGNLFGESEIDSSDDGMSSVDDLISYARSQGGDTAAAEEVITDWAKPFQKDDDGSLKPGVILVANPAKFCGGQGILPTGPSPSLLAKFGLTRPPPKDLGPDRQADLLPVLALVECNNERGGAGARGVLLNRRTGYLLGDLEQPPPSSPNADGDGSGGTVSGNPPGADVGPILEKFCIQPLWFGGIDNVSSGLDMLHQCPTVVGAEKLTEDGLYWGGDPAQAQEAMEDPSLERLMSGFDFKFFVQSTIWSTKDLEKEIKDGIWFPAEVSKEVLFKSRDRMGTQKAMPLWTEIMELMGGKFQQIKDDFYKD